MRFRSGSTRARAPTTRCSGPHLERNLELRRRYVECFDGYDEPYDVLLDDFERGMTAAEVRVVFDRLKEEQIPLVAGASRNGDRPARDRAVPARATAALRAEGDRALRLQPGVVAARSDRAPVRELDRDRRHPADDAVSRDEPRRPVRLDARVRPRAVRARRLARRSSGRRSRAARRSACTSRRAGCGRTSSAAACRSGPSSTRSCRSTSRRRSATSSSTSGSRR